MTLTYVKINSLQRRQVANERNDLVLLSLCHTDLPLSLLSVLNENTKIFIMPVSVSVYSFRINNIKWCQTDFAALLQVRLLKLCFI